MTKDKEIVLKFLDELQADLGLIIDNISLLKLGQKNIVEMLKAAWGETIPRFASIKETVRAIDSETLVGIGLSGHQLILEYGIYQIAKEKFRNTIRTDDSTKKENNERIIKSIMMLFKIMDSFLSSLAVVIPQAYAVKGFKESIENIMLL